MSNAPAIVRLFRRWLLGCVLLGQASGFAVAAELLKPSQQAREDFWVPDGTVSAMVQTNGVLYIGGTFDYISPVSETGHAFERFSGAALPDFPKFAGAIKALLPDNAGG